MKPLLNTIIVIGIFLFLLACIGCSIYLYQIGYWSYTIPFVLLVLTSIGWMLYSWEESINDLDVDEYLEAGYTVRLVWAQSSFTIKKTSKGIQCGNLFFESIKAARKYADEAIPQHFAVDSFVVKGFGRYL